MGPALGLLLGLTLLSAAAADLGCLNERGIPVDWLIVYKIPKLSKTDNFLIRNGLAYAFITSENPSAGWKISERSINDSMSIPGQTLYPVYNPKGEFHVLYNDNPPSSSASMSYGHTKGVVMSDGEAGFWLVHSVPNFPIEPVSRNKTNTTSGDRKNKYFYPATAVRFGQSFLCVSLNASQNNAIGTQLMFNRPKIYSSSIPEGFAKSFPNLTSAAKGKYVRSAPWFNKVSLKSRAGVEFASYAKSGNFMKELYSDWVAPDLATDLQVETWSNGQGELPSDCKSKFQVLDVLDVSILFDTGNSVKFKNSQDHSKWAVTVDQHTQAVCIGDINRMSAQLKRGGGTVCFKNAAVWKKYTKAVLSVQPCPNQ